MCQGQQSAFSLVEECHSILSTHPATKDMTTGSCEGTPLKKRIEIVLDNIVAAERAHSINTSSSGSVITQKIDQYQSPSGKVTCT